MILLRRNQRRTEHVSLALFCEVSIRRHERGGLEDDFTIAFECRAIAMSQVAKLRVKDRMRLLPNQQGPDWRRTVAAFRSHHLRPARATIALRVGEFARTRKHRSVPTETPFEQWQAVPQSEVGRVPPMHFEMKLAIPTVDRQSGFRRRH